jgi:orotidine-5'-phosphate decarboxylase
MMMHEARKRLIFALDVDSLEKAQGWVELLRGQVGLFKVGKQLFTRCGPRVVEMIRASGAEVFLDLKYHDIPNTVAKAGIEACRLGVGMFNVHALGGFEMMQQTRVEVEDWCRETGNSRPLMLAVTILTSSTEATLRGVGIDRPVAEMVPLLARLAKLAGFDGVVASPQEVELVRQVCGQDFALVTPGVRPILAAMDDQKRVMTPAAAIAAGASHLVIGRPISAAADPAAAARLILAEIAGALSLG